MNKNNLRSAVSVVTMCVSIAGVITTAVLTAKATPKAEALLKELKQENPEPTTMETVKKVAPAYIPAAVSGALTIGCIVATTVLSRKNQASLASAYALLNHNYQRYRNTVKKLFGEEADQKVIDEIVKSECHPEPLTSATGWSTDTLDFDIIEEKRLFYDSYSERYFESTISKVLQAEYHLNRNFALSGGVPVNMFYEFLGLEPVTDGDINGWDCEGGIYWVDFDHRTVHLEQEGNLECHVIDFVFTPWPAAEDYMTVR